MSKEAIDTLIARLDLLEAEKLLVEGALDKARGQVRNLELERENIQQVINDLDAAIEILEAKVGTLHG